MGKQTSKVPPQQAVEPQGIGPAQGDPEFADNMRRQAELQKQGKATEGGTTNALQQAAFAAIQDAVSDLWTALKEPDLQLKVNAVQAWIATAGQAQMMGFEESDLTKFEGIEAIKLLMEQLARAGHGKYALQAAVMSMEIGLPAPTASRAAVDQKVAEKIPKAAGPAPK